MTKIRLFEVGGCVRDEMLGKPTKDVDFAVEAPSFDAMRSHIVGMGLRVWLEKPDFQTIRAGVPKDHPLRARCSDADFVLCRKDGPSSDGRHPDFVEAGTIFDDLARRDFTVNAMARDVETGEFLDPHNGTEDLKHKRLRFVGKPHDRIREDGLRVLRALRFSVTKGLRIMDPEVFGQLAADMLRSVKVERIAQELEKMFRHDTLATLELLGSSDAVLLREVIFTDSKLWLLPTLKGR